MSKELTNEEYKAQWAEQPMLRPRIESVKINVSVGDAGQILENAKVIVESITGQKPANTTAKNTWRAWGIRKSQAVGCIVTLRGQPAYELLMRLFHAKDYKLPFRSIDKTGNFGFGLSEHIDIPGMTYDPKLGIIGMNVVVQMDRAGYRVKKRKYLRTKVGNRQRLHPEETRAWLSDNYGIVIE